MKAYLYGETVRVRANRIEVEGDEMVLPRAWGLLPDNALGIDLTRGEALAIRRNNPTSEMGRAIHQMICDVILADTSFAVLA